MEPGYNLLIITTMMRVFDLLDTRKRCNFYILHQASERVCVCLRSRTGSKWIPDVNSLLVNKPRLQATHFHIPPLAQQGKDFHKKTSNFQVRRAGCLSIMALLLTRF